MYYGTAYGDVRGCVDPDKLDYYGTPYMCHEKTRFFDEDGKPIGTFDTCPKVRTEGCEEEGCGVARPPEGWACRAETYTFGDIYEGEERDYIRCAAPGYERYYPMNPDGKRCRSAEFGEKNLAILYDDRGRRVGGLKCVPWGGSNGAFADWADIEADAAEDDLGSSLNPRESAGGSGDELTGGSGGPGTMTGYGGMPKTADLAVPGEPPGDRAVSGRASGLVAAAQAGVPPDAPVGTATGVSEAEAVPVAGTTVQKIPAYGLIGEALKGTLRGLLGEGATLRDPLSGSFAVMGAANVAASPPGRASASSRTKTTGSTVREAARTGGEELARGYSGGGSRGDVVWREPLLAFAVLGLVGAGYAFRRRIVT